LRKLDYISLITGCDPEFFIERVNDNKVIESNMILSKHDLGCRINSDGIQIEFNPSSSSCRSSVANSMKSHFMKLKEVLELEGCRASFKPLYDFSVDEFSKFSDESKVLGCAPSFNAYHKDLRIKVNGKDYRTRTAGGHIHIGTLGDNLDYIHSNPELFAKICDIIVGLPCVLLDRDESQIERRKNYGRAGEYRLPSHGFEYRVPSNFWLRAYPLTHLMWGLTRMAITIGISICKHERRFNNSKNKDEYRKLFRLCPRKDVEKAINTNDFDLAKKLWDRAKGFISAIISPKDFQGVEPYGHFPLVKHIIPAFDFFVEKGLDYWFKRDVISDWLKMPEGHCTGWDAFVEDVVIPVMKSGKELDKWDYKGKSSTGWGNGFSVKYKKEKKPEPTPDPNTIIVKIRKKRKVKKSE